MSGDDTSIANGSIKRSRLSTRLVNCPYKVLLNGDVVDTSDCEAFVRQGNNMCGFGEQTGVYQIVVRTDALEKSVAARFAARGGREQSCCNGCLSGEVVQIVLP